MAQVEISPAEAKLLTSLIGIERLAQEQRTLADAKARARFIVGLQGPTAVTEYEQMFDRLCERLFAVGTASSADPLALR